MKKYQHDRNNRVVVVCEKQSTQASTLQKLQAMPELQAYHNYFLFKHLEEPQSFHPSEFYQNWLNIAGERLTFY